MSGFVNVFGGNTVSPAYLNYSSFSLTSGNSPLQLVWPLQFESSTNVISQIINVTANTAGLSMIMPNATEVSVGQAVLFSNVGSNTVTIKLNDGTTTLISLAATNYIYAYLTDNTTANGTWSVIPFGAGSGGTVISVGIASSNADLTVTGSPITTSGTITLGLAGDLLALTNLSGTGIVVRDSSSSWTTTTILGTANQIVVTNGSGVAGSPTIALSPNISGITSITASNVQIGVGGTNVISGANSAPIQFTNGLSLPLGNSIYLYDQANAFYAQISGPASYTSGINTSYKWPVGYPAANGYALTSTTTGTLSWTAAGGGTVNLINTTTPILGGPINSSGTISHATSGVVAGSYTNTNLTVDSFGHIIAASNGSGGGSGSSNTITVTQASHGFTVGQWVYLNSTTYTLAQADSIITAESVGVVSAVIDTNTFTLFMEGHLTGLSGLTPGDVYWLSDATPGLATSTIPTTVGHVTKPLFVADTTTSAIVANYRGKIIPDTVPDSVSSSPVTMVAGRTYYMNNGASLVTLDVPATTAVGDVFEVVGNSSGGWVVQMNTGQTLHLGASPTTAGGTLTSANQYNCVVFKCSVANTTFTATSWTGSPVPA